MKNDKIKYNEFKCNINNINIFNNIIHKINSENNIMENKLNVSYIVFQTE